MKMESPSDNLDILSQAVARAARDWPGIAVGGPVSSVNADTCSIAGIQQFARMGSIIRFDLPGEPSFGEVVRIDEVTVVKTFQSGLKMGLGTGARLSPPLHFMPDQRWRGRIVNALGLPLDNGGPLPTGPIDVSCEGAPPSAMSRARVHCPLRTGVRVIDCFTPICAGQRIGIFAGSGVGKSTLLAMFAQAKGFDTVVVALVGERGREVREFLDDAIGANMAKSVMVVATGDESAMMRRQASRTAMTIAEFFRDCGQSVLLIVDSVTRHAHAARDVALSAGEPPVARGYPPSVFSDLPKLLERAGPGAKGSGSITGIFAVLVDGDDHNDPVADCIRGTLDGHVVLDRKIADEGRYPAVNILASLSRLAQKVWTPEQHILVRKLRVLLARYEDTRDLRLMGGYQAGNDADLDQAVRMAPKIYESMRQSPGMPPSQDAFRELAENIQENVQPN